MVNRATPSRAPRELQRTNISGALVLDDGLGAIGEGEFQGHGETGLAQRQPVRIKLAVFGFGIAFLGKGDSGKPEIRVIFPVKIGVHIPRVERRVERLLARLKAVGKSDPRPLESPEESLEDDGAPERLEDTESATPPPDP